MSETGSRQEKGGFIVGDTPHVPRHPPEADRPCNPFLAFAYERAQLLIEPDRGHSAPRRSRYP